MHVEPITCYRPRPERAAEFAAPPYDVFDRAGAAAYVAAHPNSFLAIDRPETGFAPDQNMYADEVYAHAHDLLASRVSDGTLLRDGTQCFYLWRLRDGDHVQTGIVAAFAVDDYTNGVIRRHELTRPAKVDDRARHMAATGCQTSPVLLAYRDNPVLEALVEAATAADPLYELADGAGVRHTIWRVARPAAVESLRLMLAYVERAYIADGHHRAAAAELACREARTSAGERCTGSEAYNYFLGALFPASQLGVRPYDRLVADTGGLTEDELVSSLEAHGVAVGARGERPVRPTKPGRIGMRAFGAWRELAFEGPLPDDPAGSLDVSLLQERVLGPVLGVGDPARDARISFLGDADAAELERRADAGGVAFALCPTSVERLMAVADAGLTMPPKSTWFAPKLLSGLFVRRISHRESVIDGARHAIEGNK